MPIEVTCKCGEVAELPDSAAGKKFRCACGAVNIVPASVPVSPSPSTLPPSPAVPVNPLTAPSGPPIKQPLFAIRGSFGGLPRVLLIAIAILCTLGIFLAPFSSAMGEARMESEISTLQSMGDGSGMIRKQRELDRFREEGSRGMQTACICLTVALAGLAASRR